MRDHRDRHESAQRPNRDVPAMTAPKATAGWMTTVRDVTCGARK